jgi:hypothetical protein
MHTDICAAAGLPGGGALLSGPGAARRHGRTGPDSGALPSEPGRTALPPQGYSCRFRGYLIIMTEETFGGDERTERRAADLLPEERAAGSADPQAQAEAILAESDERENDPNAAPDSFLERRSSEQTVTPGEGTR